MGDDILITVIGWWLGGFVNGIAGFGAALVAMPIVATGLDMPLALTSCTMVVLALNVQMFWIYRRHLDGSGFRGIMAGGVPGAIAGILMLRHLPEAAETVAPQEKVQSLKDALLVLKTAIVLVERFL